MYVSIYNKNKKLLLESTVYKKTIIIVPCGEELSYIEIVSQRVNRPIDRTYNSKIKFKAL